jgi:hypothetical protein
MRWAFIFGFVALSARAAAQQQSACGRVMMAFQVVREPEWIPDSTLRFLLLPARERADQIQAVVDTAGSVVTGSLHFVRASSRPTVDSVVAESSRWRFHPASNGRTKVCVLIQRTIARRSTP